MVLGCKHSSNSEGPHAIPVEDDCESRVSTGLKIKGQAVLDYLVSSDTAKVHVLSQTDNSLWAIRRLDLVLQLFFLLQAECSSLTLICYF